MTDSYQAIYDAVRSRIGSVDGNSILQSVAREAFGMGNARALLQQEIATVGHEMVRPSVLYRPTVSPDGSKWCALYGPSLMEGVCGFGDTPEQAMRDFDNNWHKQHTPETIRSGE